MKTNLRTDIPAEELFLLRIKYGTDLVPVTDICESDCKYFEKLRNNEVYDNIGVMTKRMTGLIDFDSFDGDMWDRILRRVPEFGIYCDWRKLGGRDWTYLLRTQPQFAEHCDWNKLNGWQWAGLLRAQPQFAEHCDWSKLINDDWTLLLQKQPHLAKYRE